jgi:hypothetical protein
MTWSPTGIPGYNPRSCGMYPPAATVLLPHQHPFDGDVTPIGCQDPEENPEHSGLAGARPNDPHEYVAGSTICPGFSLRGSVGRPSQWWSDEQGMRPERFRERRPIMITKLDGSSGNALGYAVSGEVTKADYDVMVPEVEAVVAEYGEVKLLCDLRDFTWEKVSAWGADLRFGREFKHQTTKMAIVGDNAFSHFISALAQPFYAQDVQYFTDPDAAWDWINAS